MLLLGVRVSTILSGSLGPGHRRTDDDQSLLLLWFAVGVFERLKQSLGLLEVSLELRQVKDEEVGSSDLFGEVLWLTLPVYYLDAVGRKRIDETTSRLAIQTADESVRNLVRVDVHVVVSELLKHGLAEKAVHARDVDTLLTG